MVNSLVFVVLFSAVSNAFAIPSRRTTVEVLDAISKVSAAVTKLDDLITAYPMAGGTLAGALDIHTNSTALDTAMKSATTVVNASGHIDHPGADDIFFSVINLEPAIDSTLVGIVNKKPAFDALPIGGVPVIILSDLATLKESTGAFANALINDSPADLAGPGTNYRDRLLQAFDAAILAYL